MELNRAPGILAIATILLALLVSSFVPVVHSDNIFTSPVLNSSQVVIQPVEGTNGKVINFWVIVFENQKTTTGTSAKDIADKVLQDCQKSSPNDIQACMLKAAEQYNKVTPSILPKYTILQNAQFKVEYLNPLGSTANGQLSTVSNCDLIVTSNYNGTCDLSKISGNYKTYIYVNFIPLPGQEIAQSTGSYQLSNAEVTPTTEISTQIQNMVDSLKTSQGTSTLPCISIFLIMGLLFASMYFAGKSPVSLLDITTPRLPTPKGVAASGQILGPFGYTEMKRTVRGKMETGAAALFATTAFLKSKGVLKNDEEFSRLENKIKAHKGVAADISAGDVEEGKRVATALVAGGRMLAKSGVPGMSASELAKLTEKSPYRYGDAEHKLAAQIMDGLDKLGGREKIMAMTIKDYIFGMRTFQSLETLTAHPEIGNRSALYYRVTNFMNKGYGVNRYAVLGGLVMGGMDSIVRSGRIVGRMSKAIVTQAPALVRETAATVNKVASKRATMTMLGKKAVAGVEEIGPKAAATASAASWLKGRPADIIVGTIFPINDKMGHLYRTLHEESLHDGMRYALRQLYKKYSINFNVDEQGLVDMGYKPIDILHASGYATSAGLERAEAELRAIFANKSLDSSQKKLDAILQLAQSHGAIIDHGVIALSQRLGAIEQSGESDHIKLLHLTEMLDRENHTRVSDYRGGAVDENKYYCHVGGDSVKGNHVWETMVLRTMVWDGEHGYLGGNEKDGYLHGGGIKEELLSARLNVTNRLVSLDPTHIDRDAAIGGPIVQLPPYMRNEKMLKEITEQNRRDLMQLFSKSGQSLFKQYMFERYHVDKDISKATIGELIGFISGGLTTRNKDAQGNTVYDKKSGKVIYWASDKELSLPQNATLVDVKRHWIGGLNARENIAICQWVESRFTRGYQAPFKASIEAELDRAEGKPGTWTVDQRSTAAKKLWVMDQLLMDMEQRFNSQFGHNTYGTTHETMRFYGGVVAGFLGKVMEEKGIDVNQAYPFLNKLDIGNPEHMRRLRELMGTYHEDYDKLLARKVTYDDIAKAQRPIVMLHEGGYAYYNKGMMLSDMDRVMAGGTCLKDEKGIWRNFVPEDVQVKFKSRDDLERASTALGLNTGRPIKDPLAWDSFLTQVRDWAKSGGYNYEKERIYGAVLWGYANATHDYERFWHESEVSVRSKREVAPVAPSILRFFGAEGHHAMEVIKPLRDIGMHVGDYVSKVALLSGGDVHRASYDITAVSSILRQHSFHLAERVMSGRAKNDLSDDEWKAYQAAAIKHGAYIQVWQFAIDRNPWRNSTSFGTHQAWSSFFNFGPSIPYNINDNLKAFMDKGEFRNFMGFYGFSMNLSGHLMRPYVNMLRGMQQSMQGYASKWDSSQDVLRQWNYTSPRIRESFQALNPFASRWYTGRWGKLANLNGYGGSLERRQLAGADFQKGLAVAPQDIMLKKKGMYTNARTEDANPGEAYYDYRMTMRSEGTMAEYLYREKEASMVYDAKLREDALNNTCRRTVSAESLCMRRDQELQSFGLMQNTLFGWANPIGFIWHMPVPLVPQSWSPRDLTTKFMHKMRNPHQGGGEGFGAKMVRMWNDRQNIYSRMKTMHRLDQITYCAKCGTANFRGARCKNIACQHPVYG